MRARPDAGFGLRKAAERIGTAACSTLLKNRPIFNPEDAKVMFQNCLGVRPPEQTDFAIVAQDLDFIVLDFLSAFLRRTAATAGEDQKWLLGLQVALGNCLPPSA